MTACQRCGFDPDAEVARSWSMWIERDPPTLNARLFNSGPRARVYRQERDAWIQEVRAARLRSKIAFAIGRRRVSFTRFYTGRQKERDIDNLIGGMKLVVDALVFDRMLVDDSPKFAELHYRQVRGSLRGLEVILEEMP